MSETIRGLTEPERERLRRVVEATYDQWRPILRNWLHVRNLTGHPTLPCEAVVIVAEDAELMAGIVGVHAAPSGGHAFAVMPRADFSGAWRGGGTIASEVTHVQSCAHAVVVVTALWEHRAAYTFTVNSVLAFMLPEHTGSA